VGTTVGLTVTALAGSSRLTTVKTGISSADEVVVVVLFLPVSEEDKFAKETPALDLGRKFGSLLDSRRHSHGEQARAVSQATAQRWFSSGTRDTALAVVVACSAGGCADFD
jgi:hypothetical protein